MNVSIKRLLPSAAATSTMLALLTAAACGGNSGNSSQDALPWHGNLTLVNSHWRDLLSGQDELRTGQSIYLQTINPALVRPGVEYQLSVENLTKGQLVQESSAISDSRGEFEMTPVLNDVGQEDGISPGDRLLVTLFDANQRFAVEIVVAPRRYGESFAASVPDPWVGACDASGRPSNAFVVGEHLAEEIAGSIHVTGSDFPPGTSEVDIYLVKDEDRWAGRSIPRGRGDGLVAGPIRAKIVDGRLPPTDLRFIPKESDLGIYDILVDVDRNGVFDYDEKHKDGADGEAKVGFTVQRSALWLAGLKDKHLLVNLAFDAPRPKYGSWRNTYRVGEKVFVYVNPPVNKSHHGKARKWIVAHRDFQSFWDKPGADGTVGFRQAAMMVAEGVPQVGCTNTPPVYLWTIEPSRDPETGQAINRFDVVIDYNKDGRYTAGVDLLDVAGIDKGAGMLDPDVVRAQAQGSGGGFIVQ